MIFGNGRLLLNYIDSKLVSSIDYFQYLCSAYQEKEWSIKCSSGVDFKNYDSHYLLKLSLIKRIWDVLIEKEMEIPTREILERILLLLASRNEISLIFLALQFEIQNSMVQAIESRPYEFIVNLLQKCLVVLKYSVTPQQYIGKSSSIVNDIIQFIYLNISKSSNLEAHNQYLYTLYDL